MNIRMLVSIAGTDFDLRPGDETDRFGEDEAIRMVAAGYAVPAVEQRQFETTVRPVVAQEKRRKKGKA